MPNLLQNKKLIGDEIPWLKTLRDAGREAFCLPTPKVEAWKYTKLHDLKADDFTLDVAPKKIKPVNLPFEAYKIYFVNGQFAPAYSNLPQGVEVLPLIEAILLLDDCKAYLNHLADVKTYPFAALNTAYLNEGVFIKVASNVNLKKPIVIINHTDVEGQNLFYNIHNVIVAQSGSSVNLVEYCTFSGDMKSRYFGNYVNEIFVAKNATVNHYKRQDEAYKAVHIALNIANVEKNGVYNSFCLQQGGNLARNEVVVRLLGENSTADVSSAYQMAGWALIDTTTVVEHLSPSTFSEQLVKGVVDGEARGIFQGKIHIAKDAIKAQGNQLHRAMLLSDTAEIDCKPELEIFADDVKCSHGAANGELDENQLFYMRSRGIDEETARQILVEAFLDDVLLKIEDDSIRNWMKSN